MFLRPFHLNAVQYLSRTTAMYTTGARITAVKSGVTMATESGNSVCNRPVREHRIAYCPNDKIARRKMSAAVSFSVDTRCFYVSRFSQVYLNV